MHTARYKIALVLSLLLVWLALPATVQASEDPDIAALSTGLQRTLMLEHNQGSIAPTGLAPGQADRFVVTQTVSGQTQVITLWIMAPGYATVAGTGIATVTESERWNGRRVFISGDRDSRLTKQIKELLAATSGPLTATIIAGSKSMELELQNRSSKPVRVYRPNWDNPADTYQWNIWEDQFGDENFDDSPTLEQMRARIVEIAPGHRLAWPMRIECDNGSDAKVDAEYLLTRATASDLGIQPFWVIASTVRAHRDAQGKYTVTPWQPAPLSPAEEAKGRQLSLFAENWLKRVKKSVKTASPEAILRQGLTRDSAGHTIAARLTLDDNNAEHVGLVAEREGYFHGLAIAEITDPISWNGQDTERAYRVPGSDWILRVKTAKGVSPEAQSAVNECLNIFLHAAKGR